MHSSSLFSSKSLLVLSLTWVQLSSAHSLFDLHRIDQPPDYWQNETIGNVGTILGCSQFCQVDRCIAFSLGFESDHSCTIWNTERREPIFIGTSNAMFPIWLKNGRKSSVFRMVFRDGRNFTLLDSFQNGSSTIMKTSVPDLTTYSSSVIHQSYDWGLISCDHQTCHRWICGSDSWSPIGLLNKGHYPQYDQVGFIHNKLWVIGGKHLGNTSYTEYLNPDDEWILGPNLPEFRRNFGIAWIKGSHVLIAGGISWEVVWLSSVYKYDIHRGTWTPIGNFAFPTIEPACERHVLGNSTTTILCVGGIFHYKNGTSKFSTQIGVYNIKADTWTLALEWDLPVGCHRPRLQATGGRLLIFGGVFEDGRRNRVLEFKEDQIPVWQERTSLPDSDGRVIPTNFTFWLPSED